MPAGRHSAGRAARGIGRAAALAAAVTVVVVSLTVSAATTPDPDSGTAGSASADPRALGEAPDTAVDPAEAVDPTSTPTEVDPTTSAELAPAITSPDPPAEPEPREPPEVPQSGPGVFDVADGDGAPADGATTYTVEVEQSVPFAAADTARRVTNTLEDERSWQPMIDVDLHRVDGSSQAADLRVLVATPDTVDQLCAPLQTMGEVSCRNGDLVVLNAVRWAEGIPDYEGRLGTYRRYLVNHEVGHYLGFGHVECPGAGEPAPLMMQQTYGLDGCSGNPWPSVA